MEAYQQSGVREACLEQIQNTNPVFVELLAPDNNAATPAYAILTGCGALHVAMQCGVFKGVTKAIFVDR